MDRGVFDGEKLMANLYICINVFEQVKEERREHAELGSELPYTRTLP